MVLRPGFGPVRRNPPQRQSSGLSSGPCTRFAHPCPLIGRSETGGIAEEQQRGATIIFSTHVMAHAEELCEQIVMIHQGRKVLDEPIAGLRRQYDTRRILLEPLDPGANLLALQSLPRRGARTHRTGPHASRGRLHPPGR